MSGILLPLFVAVPLVGAGVAAIASTRHRAVLAVTLGVLGMSTAGGVVLVVQLSGGDAVGHAVGSWPMGIAIPLVADMFSALMITMTSALTLVTVWFAVASGYVRRAYFPALVLMLVAGVNGALLTADLFNLFVFIEVMLLPSYALLVMSAPGQALMDRIRGARLYVTVNLLASTVFLAAVGFIYGAAGSVNLAELVGSAQRDPAVAVAGAVALVALAVKAALVPVHGWMVRTYTVTSPVVTALFSGIHSKVAAYAIYRVYATVFDGDRRFLWVIVAVAVVSMIVGGLGAVGETTMRGILIFSTVSQMGYIMVGLALFGPVGLMAGIFYMVQHAVVKTSLLLSTGAIEVKYGSGDIYRIHGMARREPWVAVAFFAGALSLAGIPPFSGFVAKLALLVASIDAAQWWGAAAIVVASLLTIVAMLKVWNEVFWGKTTPREDHPTGGAEPASPGRGFRPPVAKAQARVSRALLAPAMVLVAASLALGLGGELLLSLSEQAAVSLIDSQGYVEAVAGS